MEASKKRNSENYRQRSSIAVVSEARGIPLTILSLFLALQWGAIGVRNFFACGTPISGGDHERWTLVEMYGEDCSNRKYGQFTSDLLGTFSIMQAVIRVHMATTTHVADLYLTLLLLTMVDALLVLAMLRLGLEEQPMYYNVMAFGSLLYEVITLVTARKAYVARLKMKKT